MARTVGDCTAMMEVLAPGFRPTELALDDVTVGVAWLDGCDPLVRERIQDTAGRFPHRREIDFPVPHGVFPGFMGEVADVHGELFAENRDLYGADVADKVEDCLSVTPERRAQAAATRELYREQALEALGDLDLLIVPTLPFVAPEVGATWNEPVRTRMTHFTRAFNDTGWPALALPCGPAEDGLPASLQLVGRPDEDARVLAAGLSLYGR
jgi:Asp-tRNA(Asn)/Glu-tRNA(Gln) amidotransferase A subunit family amidase